MDIKPDNKFKQTLLIVIIGIMLFAALLELSEVMGFLHRPVHAAYSGRRNGVYNECAYAFL